MSEARAAVLLALRCVPLLVCGHLICLYLRRSRRTGGHDAAALTTGIIAYIMVWAARWLTSRPMNSATATGIWWQATLAGLATVGCFILVYGETYFLVERGFSLQLLVDLSRVNGEGLSVEELTRRYGGQRGLDWMLEKRLSYLEALGLLDVQGERVVLRGPLGTLCGRLGHGAKSWLHLGPSG